MKRSLIPFIREKYRHRRYVFWPDLASSHYANSVQNYLISEKVKIVPNMVNMANVSKSRPIEDFWGCLKHKVYDRGWAAKSTLELEQRIRYCLKNIDQKFVQGLALTTRKRLDRIARKGIQKIFFFKFLIFQTLYFYILY